MSNRKKNLLAIIAPGILVAATGVGAGDLATGAFAGSKLGLAVLWAVVAGAGMKYVLNEGLARWQLATGYTLLEGCVLHLGRVVQWLFLAYLLVWSFFVGSALVNACGATAHAICPLFGAETDKIAYGLLHSGAAIALVLLGGYRLFGKVMGVCIAVMFVVVVTTAVAINPPWAEVLAGLVKPRIPELSGEGLAWTVGLMGGVGGTLTVLCYGYWIREEGRQKTEDLKVCRIDLALAYTMTALFGLSMVVIGSTIEVEGKGTTLIVNLAAKLEDVFSPTAKWAFLIGAWGAMFSSVLGVWQSVPYLFANFWRLMRNREGIIAGEAVDTRSTAYRAYLFALGIIPTTGLLISFEKAQKWYAIIGAMFIPMLAAALLVLNGRASLVGRRNRNSVLVTVLFIGALAFFAFAVWFEIEKALSPAEARM